MKGSELESDAFRYEIVTDEDALRSLKRDWEDLCGRSSQHRFSQTFIWCWTNWEMVEKPQGRRLHCLVARQDHRVVLIWPFVTYRKYFVTVAAPLGCANSEYCVPLVEDSPEAEKRLELAWNILRQICPCDYFSLSSVRKGSRLQRLLVANGVKCSSEETNLYVNWIGIDNWESFYGKLSRSMRRNLERRRRRLSESAPVTFDIIEGNDCAPVIDWHLRTKVENLARSNLRGPFLEAEAYRNHLVMGASRGSSAGQVLVFVLKLCDRIIATTVARVDKIRIEVLNSTYDPAFRKYGPSRILRIEILKWAFERSLEFDMRLGEYTHKRLFANRETTVFTYEIANSAIGMVFLWLIKYYRWGKRIPSGRLQLNAPVDPE